MKQYIAKNWHDFLLTHDLASFDQLWEKELPWFEDINYGRSRDGWSGVCKIKVDGHVLYLKKQQNFYRYPISKSLGGTVAQKEYNNISLFNTLDIPCLETVYFGVRKQQGRLQAMIMTEGLEGYISFEEVTGIWSRGCFGLAHRRGLIRHIGEFLRQAHDKKVMHNSLYPKHIFLDENYVLNQKSDNQPICRFIDMERSRRARFGSRRQIRDLETLHRRTPYWSHSDRLFFLLCYLGKTRVDVEVRTFLKNFQKIRKK